MGTKS